MSKYIFIYHGGSRPESEQQGQAVMAAWMSWFATLGAAVIDGGSPTWYARTVGAGGTVTNGGGANPVTGYSLINADNLDAAVDFAKGCPILTGGGTVEVAVAHEM